MVKKGDVSICRTLGVERQKWFPMSSRGPAFERLVAFHNESLACSSFFPFALFFFVGEGGGWFYLCR